MIDKRKQELINDLWDCDDISIKIRMLKKFIKKLER